MKCRTQFDSCFTASPLKAVTRSTPWWAIDALMRIITIPAFPRRGRTLLPPGWADLEATLLSRKLQSAGQHGWGSTALQCMHSLSRGWSVYLVLDCHSRTRTALNYTLSGRTLSRLRTEKSVMLLCSSGQLQSAVSISRICVRQSARQNQQSIAKLTRHTEHGHLSQISSSRIQWGHRGHITGRTLQARSRDRLQAEAESSSSKGKQHFQDTGNGDASSSAAEFEASRGRSASESSEASTSAFPSAATSEQTAHEQIGERYPVLAKALETKDAVEASSRHQPQAVLQALMSHAKELASIGSSSLVWTGQCLTHLITKPILPRSAHIAKLRKAVQADPRNADK